ncbi:DUF447 domain-containing protein [Singulisphaera sp. PoT]|uniref:DUF447 domain-containing protein n=1 Tax=Singulisphaera sp. PoT TaxID=3411797 RepID=UPI003BF584C2
MILEGIVTTLNRQKALNIAPMGPIVEPDMRRFVFRPFRTSTTYANLKETGVGVLHVTDDVLLLARAAIGEPVSPATRPAEVVEGAILRDACRYFEFRVVESDLSNDRATFVAECVAEGRLRDFFGLNRAKFAVVEAAILATRVGILPSQQILDDFRRLVPLVEKTGGDAEREAFELLSRYVQDARPAAAN